MRFEVFSKMGWTLVKTSKRTQGNIIMLSECVSNKHSRLCFLPSMSCGYRQSGKNTTPK